MSSDEFHFMAQVLASAKAENPELYCRMLGPKAKQYVSPKPTDTGESCLPASYPF